MTNWLSRYHWRYPKALVYMLQASEYRVKDYFSWYFKAGDFRKIERRKHFVKTPKGVLLLVFAWLIVLAVIVAAIAFLWFGAAPLKYAWFVLLLFAAPYVLAYGIIIPLFIIRGLVEAPVRFFITRSTRKRLQNHKAIKIAVAGSFGKTTMREITKTVLSEGKKVAAPPESYNTPLGISKFVKTLKGDEEVLVFEMGEYYPGDVRKLCRIVGPDIGVITGVNEAHLEKFKTLSRTAQTVFELADYLGEKSVYVNGENKIARENARAGHILYDRNSVGNWKITEQKTGISGTSFVMEKNDRRFGAKSGLLGLHQVGPLAASADIAFSLGISIEEVEVGIRKTKPFAHRLEPKELGSGVVMLDDSYNGNPDGVRAVIEFFASIDAKRKFYVTPGLVEMGQRKEAVHKEIGKRLAGAGIDKVILIRNSVTTFIEEGLKEAGFEGELLFFDEAVSAYDALPNLTVEGDAILLQNDWPDQYR